MGRIIAVANQKGGVGKTTTVVNLGAGLARLGVRVLMVDLDPQGSLSYSFGLQAHELTATVYQALTRPDEKVDSLVGITENLWLLPANIELSAVENGFSQTTGRELLLKEMLGQLPAFDFVLLDCPPAMGLLTMNALAAAGELIVPLQAEYLPLQGLGRLQEVVEVVRQRLNPTLRISGVVLTRFDKRKSLHREVLEAVGVHFGPELILPPVRENVAVAEAPSFGKDIFSYKPDCTGAKDYLAICRSLLGRGR